jgi:hypothetical protein
MSAEGLRNAYHPCDLALGDSTNFTPPPYPAAGTLEKTEKA